MNDAYDTRVKPLLDQLKIICEEEKFNAQFIFDLNEVSENEFVIAANLIIGRNSEDCSAPFFVANVAANNPEIANLMLNWIEQIKFIRDTPIGALNETKTIQ